MFSVTPGSWAKCGTYIGLAVLLFPAPSGRCRAEPPTPSAYTKAPDPPTNQNEANVDYLAQQIKRVVPAANVTLIPFGNNGVILTGTASRVQDIDAIVRVAQSQEGLQVVNALKLGDSPTVELDIAIVRTKRGLTRSIVFPFVESAGKIVEGTANREKPFTGLLPRKRDAEHLLTIIGALKQEKLAKLLAQPTLLTPSGTAGNFLVGGEMPVPVPPGLGQIGVQFEEFGTRLNFLPIVIGKGKIHLELEPEVSSLGGTTGSTVLPTTGPGRTTDRTHTVIDLKEGQTLVLGGLIEHLVQHTTKKTPILSDLPIIGELFTTNEDTETEEEIIILVTPTVVKSASSATPQIGRRR